MDLFESNHPVLGSSLLVRDGLLAPLTPTDVVDPSQSGLPLPPGAHAGTRGRRRPTRRNRHVDLLSAHFIQRRVHRPGVVGTVRPKGRDRRTEPAEQLHADAAVVLGAGGQGRHDDEAAQVDPEVQLPPLVGHAQLEAHQADQGVDEALGLPESVMEQRPERQGGLNRDVGVLLLASWSSRRGWVPGVDGVTLLFVRAAIYVVSRGLASESTVGLGGTEGQEGRAMHQRRVYPTRAALARAEGTSRAALTQALGGAGMGQRA